MNGRPEGKRFSQLYLEKGAPLKDSPRFRKRLSAYYHQAGHDDYNARMVAIIERELGLKAPRRDTNDSRYDLEDFFNRSELRDVLDLITYIWKAVDRERGKYISYKWVKFVQMIFDEENLNYEIDSKGGVHYRVDAEFSRNQASTIKFLDNPRYANARYQFEQVQINLDTNPPNTIGAVNAVFRANENIFKILFAEKNVARLGASEINQCFPLLLEKIYADDLPARNAAKLLIKSFSEWTNCGHQYRHEHGQEMPLPPPMELAVALISAGASFLRFQIEIDQKKKELRDLSALSVSKQEGIL